MSTGKINALDAYVENIVTSTITADYIKGKHAVLGSLAVTNSGAVQIDSTLSVTGSISSGSTISFKNGGTVITLTVVGNGRANVYDNDGTKIGYAILPKLIGY